MMADSATIDVALIGRCFFRHWQIRTGDVALGASDSIPRTNFLPGTSRLPLGNERVFMGLLWEMFIYVLV